MTIRDRLERILDKELKYDYLIFVANIYSDGEIADFKSCISELKEDLLEWDKSINTKHKNILDYKRLYEEHYLKNKEKCICLWYSHNNDDRDLTDNRYKFIK